jgi:hypothetical protein
MVMVSGFTQTTCRKALSESVLLPRQIQVSGCGSSLGMNSPVWASKDMVSEGSFAHAHPPTNHGDRTAITNAAFLMMAPLDHVYGSKVQFEPDASSLVRNTAMLFFTAHSSACCTLFIPTMSSEKVRVHDAVMSSSKSGAPPALLAS